MGNSEAHPSKDEESPKSKPAAKSPSVRFLQRDETLGDIISDRVNVEYFAAKLSRQIYLPEAVKGCQVLANGVPNVKELRLSAWSICRAPSEKFPDVYDYFIVFRGTVGLVDWIVNANCTPSQHDQCQDVLVHSGYQSELNLIYKEVVDTLEKQRRNVKVRNIIACGHSKGGAIAQLFIDRLFWDTDHFTGQEEKNKLRSITFAAPMVFFANDPTKLEQVKSATLFTNFIIKGDPIPVMPLLMTHNVPALSCLAGVGFNIMKMRRKIEEVRMLAEMYRPVGKIFTAELSWSVQGRRSNQSKFLRKKIKFNEEDGVQNWDCVKAGNFHSDNHSMRYYSEIIQLEKDAFDHHVSDHTVGLYIINKAPYKVEITITAATHPGSEFTCFQQTKRSKKKIIRPLSYVYFRHSHVCAFEVEAVEHIKTGYINSFFDTHVFKKVNASLHGVLSDGRSIVIEEIETELPVGAKPRYRLKLTDLEVIRAGQGTESSSSAHVSDGQRAEDVSGGQKAEDNTRQGTSARNSASRAAVSISLQVPKEADHRTHNLFEWTPSSESTMSCGSFGGESCKSYGSVRTRSGSKIRISRSTSDATTPRTPILLTNENFEDIINAYDTKAIGDPDIMSPSMSSSSLQPSSSASRSSTFVCVEMIQDLLTKHGPGLVFHLRIPAFEEHRSVVALVECPFEIMVDDTFKFAQELVADLQEVFSLSLISIDSMSIVEAIKPLVDFAKDLLQNQLWNGSLAEAVVCEAMKVHSNITNPCLHMLLHTQHC